MEGAVVRIDREGRDVTDLPGLWSDEDTEGQAMSDYDDQDDKDLNLHIAKMLEHMEWEATLPNQEKAKRRLARFISQLPQTAELAAKCDMPYVMFGCIERIVFYCEEILGPDWREQVKRERKSFLYDDDEGDECDE